MQTLIIYAHPDTEPRGNCWHILKEVERTLKERDREYRILDLYREKFDPVLHEQEHYVSGGRTVAREVQGYQKMFEDAEHLVVIHPIWWGGMPAILKGYFDRLLTPGFGYKYLYGIPHKLFKGKRAVVFQTSGGPWWWSSVVQGARANKNIARDILGFLGVKTKVCLVSHARKVTDERKVIIQRCVHEGLESLW